MFGADLDPTFQYVTSEITTTKQVGTIAYVALFDRVVDGKVQIQFIRDGGDPEFAGNSTLSDADGMSGKYNLEDFPGPGHYSFTVLFGPEPIVYLATGSLDITAP
jgi:hypothetical protein